MYKPVIGLEIHAQLATESKIFCFDPVEFGGAPNTRTSPISLGHPGTLPNLNRRCIEMAIMMGLATNCKIREFSYFARKNYFYPDLPKGYQISQHETPICYDGYVNIRLKDGSIKKIGIERIHIEEDSGKSLHDQDLYNSLIDLNRAGTGLIEIVSKPHMSSAEEAAAYINEIRKIVRYLRICDGNMEEGSLRCDVNISVMRIEEGRLGTRAEIKNMNSISNVMKAIQYEIERQIGILESGGKVIQETRGFDVLTGKTVTLREKESSDDYRYFPEPDLLPLVVTAEMLEELRKEIPKLPEELYEIYTKKYHLSAFDAHLLTEQRELSEYFEQVVSVTDNYKAAANWINTIIKGYLNEMALDITQFPLKPETIAEIILLIERGEISHTAAKEKLFPLLLSEPHRQPLELAQEHHLLLSKDTAALERVIDQVLAQNQDKVKQYLQGKTGLLGYFVGQVMKASPTQVDPKLVNQLLTEKIHAQN
ncbi:MAG: Asp-tRNA(Asn)/Glu-tRNA(Gln) amidotransferase subunit GatB [Bacteroidia bacterium]|nr:Asp-tRNA(Asn)/Glu-tRNA(Gln) amidotransferase subunit GatB [Bacteroidia bacterium]